MEKTVEELKENAFLFRDKYRKGQCSRETALIEIMPFINVVNKKADEVSKKFSVKSKKVNFISFVR